MIRWTRFLPWWIPVLALVLAVVWTQRVRIAERLVTQALESEGVEVRVLELETADLSRVVINGALLDFGQFSVTAQGIEAQYDLERLFRGTVDNLAVSSASIRINPARTGDDAGGPPLSLDSVAQLLAVILDIRLPVETFEVDRLTIDDRESVLPVPPPPGHLLITSFGREMLLQSSVRNAHLDIRKTNAGIDAGVSDAQGTESARITLSISRNAEGAITQISGTLTSDLDALMPLLLLDPATNRFNVSGKADLDLVATVREDSSWYLTVKGTLPDLADQDIAASGLALGLGIRIPMTGFPVSLSIVSEGLAGIRADRIAAGDVSVEQLYWQPNGTVTREGLDVRVSLAKPSALSFSRLIGKDMEMGKTEIRPTGSITAGHDTLKLALEPTHAGFSFLRVGDATVRDVRGVLAGQLEIADGETRAQLASPTRLGFAEILTPEIVTGTGHIGPVLSYSASEQEWAVVLHRDTIFQSDSAIYDGTSISDIALSQSGETRIRAEAGSSTSSWSLQGGSWQTTGTRLETGNLAMRAQQMTLELLDLSGDRSDFHVALQDAVLETDDQTHALEQAAVNASVLGDEVSAEGSFTLRDIPAVLRFSAQQNMQSGSGTGRIFPDQGISLSDHGETFLSLLMPEESEVALDGGMLGFEYQPTWRDGELADHLLEITLDDLSGSYADILFSGLSLSGSVFCGEDGSGDLSVTIEQIRYGVEIRNLQSGLCVEADSENRPPRFHVRDIRASFLNGSIRARDFVYDSLAPYNRVSLEIDGLDIETLVEMQQIEHLSATGWLHGQLPIRIGPDGVSITGGRLTSRQSGRIHYRLDPAIGESAVNPAIWPALKGLTDFHYDLLDAEVDFEPDGELLVRLRIEGSNPEFENGRAIHLNINSQQNVLSLLKSLQYTSRQNSGQDAGILHKSLIDDALKTNEGNTDAES